MSKKQQDLSKRDKLLSDLEDSRSFCLRQLADEAEERGEDTTASGYRWLADNKKSPRRNNLVYEWFYSYNYNLTKFEYFLPYDVKKYGSMKTSVSFSKIMDKAAKAVGRWLEEAKQ